MQTNKTHKVIDLCYTEDEGNQVMVGTEQECNEFINKQEGNDWFTYKVIPLSKKEKEIVNSIYQSK